MHILKKIRTFAVKYKQMNTIKIFIYKHQGWIISIAWMTLLSMFTYTDLVCTLLKPDTSFLNVYGEAQMHIVSLLVNIGLLFMLIFDFMGTGKEFSYKEIIAIMSAVIMSVIILGLSKLHAQGEIHHYVAFIQSPTLLYTVHGLFLAVLTWLKYKSIEKECAVESCIVKKEF